MIDTILFDLDGTLAQFSQQAFINAYFAEIGKVFTGLGMDATMSIKAVWVGTKSMIENDGSRLNIHRFWEAFTDTMGISYEQGKKVEEACDSFYQNEFDVVKSILQPSEIPKRLIRNLSLKGYITVLATNPLFPDYGIKTRLNWIGLKMSDFLLVTHYNNSSYCKPNLSYYREVLSKISKSPHQCIMVGNNPAEDMIAGEIGMDTFLVTDYLENETGMDISEYRYGTLDELERVLMALPDNPVS